MDSSVAFTLPPDVLQCRDPATSELLGQAPVFETEDVDEAVARARRAQRDWHESSARQRRRLLQALLGRIVRGQDELCRLAVHDTGKTMVDVAVGELWPACEALQSRLTPRGRWRSRGRRTGVPASVVGIFPADDFPLRDLLVPLARTLMDGGAALLYASQACAWCSSAYVQMVADILREQALPPDLVQLVSGGQQTQDALVQRCVDRIQHRSTSEVLVIRREARLSRAASLAAFSAFSAAGPTGSGIARVHVHRTLRDAFLEHVTRHAEALRQGPPLLDEPDCGALQTERDLARLATAVADAQQRGAEILLGGNPRDDLPGTYFAPTVLVGASSSLHPLDEDVRGPVMAVGVFDDEAELAARLRRNPVPTPVRILGRHRSATCPLTERLHDSIVRRDEEGIPIVARTYPALGNPVHPVHPWSYPLLESTIATRFAPNLTTQLRAGAQLSQTITELLRGSLGP